MDGVGRDGTNELIAEMTRLAMRARLAVDDKTKANRDALKNSLSYVPPPCDVEPSE